MESESRLPTVKIMLSLSIVLRNWADLGMCDLWIAWIVSHPLPHANLSRWIMNGADNEPKGCERLIQSLEEGTPTCCPCEANTIPHSWGFDTLWRSTPTQLHLARPMHCPPVLFVSPSPPSFSRRLYSSENPRRRSLRRVSSGVFVSCSELNVHCIVDSVTNLVSPTVLPSGMPMGSIETLLSSLSSVLLLPTISNGALSSSPDTEFNPQMDWPALVSFSLIMTTSLWLPF